MSSDGKLFELETGPAPSHKGRTISIHKTEVVPLDWLKHHPKNARAGNVAMVMESLMVHGQVRPMVVNKRDMNVLIGNHTLQALRELGAREALVSFVDVDEQQAIKILLIENKTNDGKRFDPDKYHLDKLELLLQEVSLDGTGWTDVEKADVSEQLLMVRDGEKLVVPGKTGAAFAETEEEFEKRANRAGGGHQVNLRELVILLSPNEHDWAMKALLALERRWKLKGGHPAIFLRAMDAATTVWLDAEAKTSLGPVPPREQKSEQPEVLDEEKLVAAIPMHIDPADAIASDEGQDLNPDDIPF